MRSNLKFQTDPDHDADLVPTYENLQPEQKLLLNIIERALRDALALSIREQTTIKDRSQATQFILDQSAEPWGFAWIADHIGLSERFQERVIELVRHRDQYAQLISARLAAGKGILI